MSVKDKLNRAKENSWLTDALTLEERIAAESIAQIATTIQRQRKSLGYSQQDLAKKLSVSQAMVSRWENGEENFTVITLARISTALGMKLHNPLDNCVIESA